MHLKGKIYVNSFKSVKDWIESICEIVEPFLEVGLIGWWERVKGVPNTGTGKTIYNSSDANLLASRHVFFACINKLTASIPGIDQLLGCTFPNALGISIAVNTLRKNSSVTFIDMIANGLPHKVGGNRKA
jgi:hypothetical protein